MAEYIDREKLYQHLNDEIEWGRDKDRLFALEAVNDFPAADVAAVVHAKWDDSLDGLTPYCTECGCSHRYLIRRTLYCPNCGAKMDLE